MWRVITSMTLAVGLAGCSFTDDFNPRVARYDVAVTQSRDAMILANIVRASKAEPLSFIQVGKVTGSNTQSGTFGLPAITLGPHIAQAASATLHAAQSQTIFGASAAGGQFTGNSTSMSGSTSFEVSPTETKAFYQGLLTEVEPRTLEFFRRQGIARELLFYLFTDRVEVERPGKPLIVLRNDPLMADSFKGFQRYVDQAMEYGLSSEPTGRQVTHKASAKNKTGDSADKSTDTAEWHLCFDPKDKAAGVTYKGNSPICGQPVGATDTRTVTFVGPDGAKVALTVQPRSVFAIFEYLGRLIVAGESGQVKLHSPEAIDYGPLEDPYLFQVTKGVDGAGCFTSVVQDGESYCVPLQGATNTKRVLGLLIQLIALNTSVSDIPLTPTFHLLPQ